MSEKTTEAPFVIGVTFFNACDACGQSIPSNGEFLCTPCKVALFPHVTITKTQEAPPVGEYKPTSVDAAKDAADFRVIGVSPFYVRWKDGRTEQVTSLQLKRLQAAHTWATDF